MQLDLNDEQSLAFLKLIYLGHEIVSTSEFNDSQKMEDVIQLIYKNAYESGFKNFIDYDKDDDYYYPTYEFEDDKQITSLLEDYEDEVTNYFISDESLKLAERDYKEKYNKSAPNDFSEELMDMQDRYYDEILDNGLVNFRLNK